jgi:hypothetical protein
MSKSDSTGRSKGRLPPFVPLLRETLSTLAWRAMSHGARSLYVALKARVNNDGRNNGHVFLPTRAACAETGSSNEQIVRWFRELQHYGFIVQTSAGYLGVDGHGKAPHWRLTELGSRAADGTLDLPTRDFLQWSGDRFRPRTQKQNPDAENRITPMRKSASPVMRKSASPEPQSDAENRCIETPKSDAENRCISSNQLVANGATDDTLPWRMPTVIDLPVESASKSAQPARGSRIGPHYIVIRDGAPKRPKRRR